MVAWIDDEGAVEAIATFSVHHRQPRGMGGSSLDVNRASNLLLLCGSGTTGCHGMVESQRVLAYAHGWLVPRSFDTTLYAVLIYTGDVVYLTDDGTYREGE